MLQRNDNSALHFKARMVCVSGKPSALIDVPLQPSFLLVPLVK